MDAQSKLIAATLDELHVAISGLAAALPEADLDRARSALRRAGEMIEEIKSGRHYSFGAPAPD